MTYEEILDLKNKNKDNKVFMFVLENVNYYFSRWYNSLIENDNQVQLLILSVLLTQYFNPYISTYFFFY